MAHPLLRSLTPIAAIVGGYLHGRQDVPFWELTPVLFIVNMGVAALFLGGGVDGIHLGRGRRIAACAFGLILLYWDPIKFACGFVCLAWSIVIISPLAASATLFRDGRSWPIRVGSNLLLFTSTSALAYNARAGMSGIGYFGAWVS